MEKTTILGIGKYTSLIVMLLTAVATIITATTGYLSMKDYGAVIIAFGVFIVALRNYIKDHYGVL
jgi:ABC-type transporter Mla maintaining outer membrane lipid asymmetry permease subunit MlaE